MRASRYEVGAGQTSDITIPHKICHSHTEALGNPMVFRDLDAAALRRFTFKMEFLELDVAQRWSMFLREAGLTEAVTTMAPATKERWQQKLTLMKFLTPGDFATVKRQCIALDAQLSAEEWLDQLQIECDIKNAPRRMRPQH